MNLEICDICSYEDFGKCARRDEKDYNKIKAEFDENSKIVKCTGFTVDIEIAHRRFRNVSQVKPAEAEKVTS